MSCCHRYVGLIIFLLLVVHFTFGYFRPASPTHTNVPTKEGREDASEHIEIADESGERQDASKITCPSAPYFCTRFAWETCHRFMGLVILMLGWFNCVDGFGEYEEDYDGESLLVNGPAIFLALQGAIGALILFLLSAKASTRNNPFAGNPSNL